MKKWPLLLTLFCISITTGQVRAGDCFRWLTYHGKWIFVKITSPLDENNPNGDLLGRVITRNGTPYTVKMRYGVGWAFCDEKGDRPIGPDPDPALFD